MHTHTHTHIHAHAHCPTLQQLEACYRGDQAWGGQSGGGQVPRFLGRHLLAHCVRGRSEESLENVWQKKTVVSARSPASLAGTSPTAAQNAEAGAVRGGTCGSSAQWLLVPQWHQSSGSDNPAVCLISQADSCTTVCLASRCMHGRTGDGDMRSGLRKEGHPGGVLNRHRLQVGSDERTCALGRVRSLSRTNVTSL